MDIQQIITGRRSLPILVGVAGVGIGFGVGYILGKRVQTVEFHQDILIELEDTSDDEGYEDIIEVETSDPVIYEEIPEPTVIDEEVVSETQVKIVAQEQIAEGVVVRRNVFTPAANDQWVYDDEIAHRDAHPGEPHVIHHDEFMNNEKKYNQETLTYYKGDDIVADQEDKPIYNYSTLMGHLKFGHGSGDENVVYIRNETINMEWEVLLHDGSYETEVLGLQIEDEYEKSDIKHAHVRRFRPVD